jgi:predicted RNase H-like nuclease (RuvC/YqgF family)
MTSVACKNAHVAAFNVFRERCKVAADAIISTPPPLSTSAPVAAPSTTLTHVWESCKANKHMKDIVMEVEQQMKDQYYFDLDEDDPCDSIEYVFDPVEGFTQIAIHANSYKKEFTQTKQEMQRAIEKNERELVEHRRAIMDQRAITMNQQHEIKDLRGELSAYRQENQELRDEIQKYQQELELLRQQIVAKKD